MVYLNQVQAEALKTHRVANPPLVMLILQLGISDMREDFVEQLFESVYIESRNRPKLLDERQP